MMIEAMVKIMGAVGVLGGESVGESWGSGECVRGREWLWLKRRFRSNLSWPAGWRLEVDREEDSAEAAAPVAMG